jgi:hypothetical protein
MKDTVFQSSAYGKRESVATNIDGRAQFDMLDVRARAISRRARLVAARNPCTLLCSTCAATTRCPATH